MNGSGLIRLVLELGVIGFLLWLILTYIPMADPIKKVITVIVVIACVLWCVSAFGLFGTHTRVLGGCN